MAEWTYDRFPQLDRTQPSVGRAGVYSETPDLLPIFGPPRPGSRLCYLVGCNAWGQVRVFFFFRVTHLPYLRLRRA